MADETSVLYVAIIVVTGNGEETMRLPAKEAFGDAVEAGWRVMLGVPPEDDDE